MGFVSTSIGIFKVGRTEVQQRDDLLDQIAKIQTLLPNGTNFEHVQKHDRISLDDRFTVWFSHPVFETGDTIELVYSRQFYQGFMQIEQVYILHEIKYLTADGTNKY